MNLRQAFLFAGLLLGGCYNDAEEYRNLAVRHSVAVGQVSSTDCGNHGAIYYTFEVSGRSQGGRVPQGLLECSAARKGMPVTVYYDPAKPSVYTLEEPSLLYEREHGYSVPYLWLVVVLLVLGVAVTSSRRSRRGNSASPGPKAK